MDKDNSDTMAEAKVEDKIEEKDEKMDESKGDESERMESTEDKKDDEKEEEKLKSDNFDDEIMIPHQKKSQDESEEIAAASLPDPPPKRLLERRESLEKKNKRELEEEEREKMQVLVSNFTEDQLDRYEMFRRSAFPKAAIKRIMQTITGCSVSQNVVIAMSGIAKVFIGEIVEEALNIMESQDETGPLQPKHLREAVRVLRAKGTIPHAKCGKTFQRL
ncbi:hypothetical protein TKK_0003771 [Trichogramma kaykai]|uniref:TAFII28-like protein domain-containing protein n=1 Tax=Trichogramma kaykai TaxID=54128 RepID=A0ABD2XPM7_9HYME